MERKYEFLGVQFLEAMNDIGRYGNDTFGADSLNHRQRKRHEPEVIAAHASVHFNEYLRGVKHDRFKTRKHQLAAVAFNAMMEFQFARLDEE